MLIDVVRTVVIYRCITQAACMCSQTRPYDYSFQQYHMHVALIFVITECKKETYIYSTLNMMAYEKKERNKYYWFTKVKVFLYLRLLTA